MQSKQPTSGESEFKIIRNIAELRGKLFELDEATKISDDALRAAFKTFAMDFSYDVPDNPHAIEYRNKQFEIYELIAGKSYGVKNEGTQIDGVNSASRPFPYYTESYETVGNHLISIGFLIKTMGLAPKSRVLEFGPGWGNTTEAMARMGYEVTAVDIEQNFIDLINERAKRNQVSIETICDDFAHIENVQEPFDAILFFECFHHCSDHLRLIRAFERAVKPGGKIIFGAEPITDAFPLPWGLRLDGESLWAIRNFGWLELGFQEKYFRETLEKYGWKLAKHVCPETPWGTVFVATR